MAGGGAKGSGDDGKHFLEGPSIIPSMASSLLDPTWQLPERLVNTSRGPPSPEGLQREQEGSTFSRKAGIAIYRELDFREPSHCGSGAATGPGRQNLLGGFPLVQGDFLQQAALDFRAMENV